MHSRINDGDLLEFENVFVYASDPFDEYMAANASYSNLCLEQKPNKEGNLKIKSFQSILHFRFLFLTAGHYFSLFIIKYNFLVI